MKKGIPGAAGCCDKCVKRVDAHFVNGIKGFGKFCAKHAADYLEKSYPKSRLIKHYREMEKNS